ncbi:Protein C activator [Seminavis robusta]|uniref:Protein C activator n=1 Tax=Seminavis robusta TaxID=568900 RepID=A0A9N8HQ57_9STRA|nr:Protein C activator [Seminavis robusta]|eukprot:Sro1160_g247710.1 Protein C activator (321) ;mRNA; r:12056-13324
MLRPVVVCSTLALLVGLVAFRSSIFKNDDGKRPWQKADHHLSRLLRARAFASYSSRQLPDLRFVLLQGEKETCWGSLVHDDIVLTAGQCDAYLQFNDTAYVGFPQLSQAHQIDFIEVHPRFDFPYADFAVIKLATPVPNAILRPISQNQSVPAIGNNQATFMRPTSPSDMTDVGVSRQSQPSETENVPVQILPKSTCQEVYQPPIIHALMICAAVNDTNNITQSNRCMNDAGSPLLDQDGFQIGIASTGNGGCGSTSAPGLFSRVAWASPWIQQVICALSASPPPACGVVRTGIEQEQPSKPASTNPFTHYQGQRRLSLF